jgi:hypothetical protein
MMPLKKYLTEMGLDNHYRNGDKAIGASLTTWPKRFTNKDLTSK